MCREVGLWSFVERSHSLVETLAKRPLLPAFGRTFKHLDSVPRKETRPSSDPAPSVFLICLEEGWTLNEKCSDPGSLQRLTTRPNQTPQNNKKKTRPQTMHVGNGVWPFLLK